MNNAPDYIAELALIETSRQQREALEQTKWKPKKDHPLVSKRMSVLGFIMLCTMLFAPFHIETCIWLTLHPETL